MGAGGGAALAGVAEVFNPALHFTSGFLAETLRRPGLVPPGGAVLDLGTGSGIAAIAAGLGARGAWSRWT